MVVGDAVIETGTTAGGGSTTITVPAGETWIISAYGSPGIMALTADDGSNTPKIKVRSGASGDNTTNFATRAVFDDSVDPRVENGSCSSGDHYLGGREV